MSFADAAANGPLLLAVGAAAAAGLVSFLSPCVLPLVPGYVSYVTGLAGADLDAALGTDPLGNAVTTETTITASRVRGRVVAGTLLFIGGFTAVFTAIFTVTGLAVGRSLLLHERAVEIVAGSVIVVLGVLFAGLVPGMQREFRIHRLPSAGLLGAPVLGAVFALSWTPCIGPTLGTVLTLAVTDGGAGRAVTLGIAYCLGLGLPFLIFGLGFRRLLGVFAAIRRHSRWVTRIGGGLLVVIGLALVTGAWTPFTNWLLHLFGGAGTGLI
jgi:cytochrome c-type biogenesis protein